MTDHFYAVIMAGGGGTRLWPVSRQATPKQMLKLFDNRSLFQISTERLKGIFPQKKIFVVTTSVQAKELWKQVPHLPVENYLLEPAPRGTAAVVAMAAAAILKRDPQAVLAVLTADHFIENVEGFQNALLAANALAKNGYVVTLGIKPTYAATGYGYVESGEVLGEYQGLTGYQLRRFVEKPDGARAKTFLENNLMNWNSGMFITRADIILAEYERLLPDLYGKLMEIRPWLGEDHSNPRFMETWSSIIPQTIDYGIMEKCNCAAVIPTRDLGWNDVGSWDSFFEVMPADENGNIILEGKHVGLDTSNSLVVSTDPKALVVTMGMKNVIIVNTPNAVLICPRGESQHVKEIVKYLKDNHYTLFL